MAAPSEPLGIRVHLGFFGPPAAPGEPATIRARLAAEEARCSGTTAATSHDRAASHKQMDHRIQISLDVG